MISVREFVSLPVLRAASLNFVEINKEYLSLVDGELTRTKLKYVTLCIWYMEHYCMYSIN